MTTSIYIHDATAEQYASVPAPKQETGGMRWKWYILGSVEITVYDPTNYERYRSTAARGRD